MDKEPQKTVGQIIVKLRKEKDMTQDILADRLDVSRQQISKWENDVASPSDKQIEKMCGIFQVTTDCFIVNQTVNVIEKEKVAIAKPETTDAEKKRIAEIERKEEEIRSFRAFYEKNEKRKRLILLKTLGILFSATGAVSCFFAVIFAFTAFSRTTGIEVIHTASYATKELDIFLMIVTVACVFAAVCFFRKYKKVKIKKRGNNPPGRLC